MKKILSFALILLLSVGFLSTITSTAATVPSVYMRPVFNEDKTMLTVEVYTNGLRWTEFDGGIQFDPAAMTLISVTEGGKIVSARAKANEKGFDILSASRDVAQSNQAGYCNFIVVSGWQGYNVTSYAGSVVFFTFAIKDLAKAKTGYHLCINTLTDVNGKALVSYSPFALSSPVVYLSNEKNPFLYGDVNMDGKVSITDAMLIMQYKADMINLAEEYQKFTADVSGDQNIAVSDAMLIMQYLAEILTKFPVQG